jgi:hypothetical protein
VPRYSFGWQSRLTKLLASAALVGTLAFATFVKDVFVPIANWTAQQLGWTDDPESRRRTLKTEYPPEALAAMKLATDHTGWVDAILHLTSSIAASMNIDIDQHVTDLEKARLHHTHFLEQFMFMEIIVGFQQRVMVFQRTRDPNDYTEMKRSSEQVSRALGKFRAMIWESRRASRY